MLTFVGSAGLTNGSLLEVAEEYTRLGYTVIPTKDKIPVIKWTERRGTKATREELQQWFVSNPNVEGLGIILDMSIVVIETDGYGENVFNSKVLSKFTPQLREAYRKSTMCNYFSL